MKEGIAHRRPLACALLIAWFGVFLAVAPGPTTALAGVVVNGDFSQDLSFGWNVPAGADVVVDQGQAVLTKGGDSWPELSQTFTIPAGTPLLSFTITALNFTPYVEGEFKDAFEVHLVATESGESLLKVPLSGTTALLNYQQTGELYFATGVTVPEAIVNGDSWNPSSLPVAVTIGLDPVPTQDISVTLTFDIVGEQPAGSSVAIDNVITIAHPIAVDDAATTAEDIAVAIAVLANDDDPDGTVDPATVKVTVAPLHGQTVVDDQTGVITYSPASDYYGTDFFSYTVEDDAGNLSNTAEVTVIVTSVNDPPVARTGEDRTVNEGDVVVLDGSGSSDPDDGIASYQWTVVSTAGFMEGQEVIISDPVAAITDFTAPRVEIRNETGTIALRLTVTDTAPDNALSHSSELTVTVRNVVLPGDVDDSGVVDLSDLISILKLLTHVPLPGVAMTPRADISGDGALGTPEANYILRRLSGN